MTANDLLHRYCIARDAGDFSLEGELLEANRGLAITYARRRSHRYSEDHTQAAMLGILRALRSFDPTRGTKLSSWAWLLVRKELDRADAGSNSVSVPRRAKQRATFCGHDDASKASASIEDRIIDAEPRLSTASVAACWRGEDRLERCLAAAAAFSASSIKALWPADPHERLEVLARGDAALDQLTREFPEDAAIWSEHHIEGRTLQQMARDRGVSRPRLGFRARRREARLAEIIDEMRYTPREALVLWASRPPIVHALEDLGLADATTSPMQLNDLAEDLARLVGLVSTDTLARMLERPGTA